MFEPDFIIESREAVSQEFRARGISTFYDAVLFVQNLQYGRNADKQNLITVFHDSCGTCSTKHALLKSLAIENNFDEIRLMIGIFRMNGENTPAVADVLKEAKLDFIPEAHNYLRYHREILDFTSADSKPEDFIGDLLEEIEVTPAQITAFKMDYHRKYLQQWTLEIQSSYTLDELWTIREACIQSLSK
ncbi:MAG TPA: hypothetical protein VF676_02855 [Flavobacterium sp.]|jgi:hypothetical protein